MKDGTATATKSAMTVSGIEPTGGEFQGVVTKKPGNIGESDYTTLWTLDSNL
jgi:hypothetical protein